MHKRYPALHIISLMLKVLSVVTIIIGIFLIIVMLSSNDAVSGLPQIFGSPLVTLGVVPVILFTLISALVLWGIAELIICLIDIEKNTRVRAESAAEIAKVGTSRIESVPTPVPAPASVPAISSGPAPALAPQPTPVVEPKIEPGLKEVDALADRKKNIMDILNRKIW
jgi:Na+-transporting methylmalonyl-CoA/oxaloacetate decarboxylase gamma subunit